MTVHIDEVHSDVVAAGAPVPPGHDGPPVEPPWVAEERWRAARDRLAWLADRVRAAGFDD